MSLFERPFEHAQMDAQTDNSHCKICSICEWAYLSVALNMFFQRRWDVEVVFNHKCKLGEAVAEHACAYHFKKQVCVCLCNAEVLVDCSSLSFWADVQPWLFALCSALALSAGDWQCWTQLLCERVSCDAKCFRRLFHFYYPTTGQSVEYFGWKKPCQWFVREREKKKEEKRQEKYIWDLAARPGLKF